MFTYLSVLGLSCSTWDLVPWPEMVLRPPALGKWSSSHYPPEKSLWCYCKLSLLFYFSFCQVTVSRYADYWYLYINLISSTWLILYFIVYLLILLLFIVYLLILLLIVYLLILLLFIAYLLILLLFIVYSKVFQGFQVCNMSTTDSDSFAFSF